MGSMSSVIVVISKVKNTLKTIQECNRNPTKPKGVRIVHWRAIVRDSPNYIKIFQQIEDESVLILSLLETIHPLIHPCYGFG